MAAVKDVHDPLWINQVMYDAEEMRRNLGYQLAAGAAPGTSRTGVLNVRDLALSLSGSNVMVGAGGAVIGTAKGAYVCGVAATTTIGALLAADVTNPRRDRVVLEILDPDNGGEAGRKAQLRIIDGTPNALAATGGGFPAAPTSPFIDLGHVDVPKVGAGSPTLTATVPLTAAAGAPVPVRTQAEADGLPKWNGALRLRLDLPGRPLQISDGTRWSTVSPVVRTDFNVSGLANQMGTDSRILANLPLVARPYPRLIRLCAQSAVTPATIANGVSTVYLAVSLMQASSANAQGKAPLSWTAPGAYILGTTVDSGEILVPANTNPLARMWIHVAQGSISTTVSGDPTVTKFWAEERPAEA